MTRQEIFDTSARGLLLQGCKSHGTGQMWGHAYMDAVSNRCALGLLVPCMEAGVYRLSEAITMDLNIIFNSSISQDKLALELMRIHNCCEVTDWPTLLAACAKQFNLEDSVISVALAEVAQRAVGEKVPELVEV